MKGLLTQEPSVEIRFDFNGVNFHSVRRCQCLNNERVLITKQPITGKLAWQIKNFSDLQVRKGALLLMMSMNLFEKQLT